MVGLTVLIADKCDAAMIEKLQQAGHNVIVNPSLKDASLAEAISTHNPQAVMVRSTKVQREHFDASDSLKLCVRLGAGYDTIDTAYAKEKGVRVCNTPGTNSVAVAELAMGLILSCDRFIPDNVIDARAGKWNKAAYSKGLGLKGKTVGLIGYGNIGKAVAQRAKAFEMNVLVYSRSMTPEKAQQEGVQYAASPLEVAERADIVSLHAANSPQTKGMCNAEFFEKMKNGAIFINTARAALVDEQALIEAMNTKGIKSGVDVPLGEPSEGACAFESPLTLHPRAYVTSHTGASTEQASAAVGDVGFEVVEKFAAGELIHCVNL
ncbi:hypothetical protein RCL1_002023 [Eukaryota sp. TZLM3-RCL]